MMLEEDGFGSGLCPSFCCYSFNGFAEAAARVTTDSDLCAVSGNDSSLVFESVDDEFQEEDDFEFVSIREDEQAFPTFYRGVLENQLQRDFRDTDNEDILAFQNSITKLMLCDRDPPSSSSSELDEMDRIPPGTCCTWTPKTAEVSEGRGEKSKSNGSSSSPSRWWKLRNLLWKSCSDGKSSVAFFKPMKNEAEGEKVDGEDKSGKKPKGKRVSGKKPERKRAPVEKASPGSAHEALYVNYAGLEEQGKRKSYLPYKKDLAGNWINFNVSGNGKVIAVKSVKFKHF